MDDQARSASTSSPTDGPSQPNTREAPFRPGGPPPLGLPKSGGALRGLGEKFQAGAPTGTGKFQVPLPVSPCRSAEPKLSLQYDSGYGNGPFGMGWTTSVPNITRRTDKGMPKYADALESDIFVLSGQEDLVPELAPSAGGAWSRQTTYDGAHRVDTYRPRVEGLFARIERRTHVVTGDVHWRSITPDNVTSYFGLSPGARITNPANPLQVFCWLLEATVDSLGRVIFYEYKADDLTGVSVGDPSEAARRARPPANAYPKRIHYGNRTPLATRDPAYTDLTALTWLFEIVFDYGEHTTDLPEEAGPWALRPDPFSTYRSSFEIRTYRLCQRVLLFHEIPEELGAPARLVKSTELTYDASPIVTYLTSVRGVGYAWNANGVVSTDHTPTLQLDYTRVGTLSTAVTAVSCASLAQAPAGIDAQNYQLVDLDGEGIAGILSPAAAPSPTLYYKRNLGGGAFAPAESLPAQPSLASVADGVHLVSLNADGRLDVAMFDGPTPGFYERTRDFAWSPFTAFSSLPRIDWRAREVHLLDVDGDGLTDVLLAQDDVFVWYPSQSRGGFGPANRRTQAHDEDRGAVVLTTDDYETIFLADMSGDGLQDLVRIRNGDVCYWPNLGYGRFGAKIAMKNAPVFDRADLFDPRRIRLGDIDGAGVTDIVYLSRGGADIYLNQAGNGWNGVTTIPLPLADTMASVRVADFLGTGTACLVWSSTDPADAGTALRYVDLLHGTKPHLLSSVVNGVGATTTITYAPSTKFYLQDRLAGRPWATRLPFVVQTVACVQTIDAVAGTHTVLRYRYAHGWFDGVEREFRGFARVDTWDAESMSADYGAGLPPGSLPAVSGEFDLPPIHTISWFHTGAWNGQADDLVTTLSQEFYAGDPAAATMAPTTVPTTLQPPDLREVYRSLKGKPLRTEVYAEDGTSAASAPYVVTQFGYEVREEQPIATQRHGVYYPFEREHVASNYERNPTDPRVVHHLALEVDSLGHVVRDADLAYARRAPAQPEQGGVLATCRTTTFGPLISTTHDFRHGVATETVQYELAVSATATVLPLATVDAAMTGATVLPFDGALTAGTMRTIEHVQHQFWSDDLSAPLPQGQVQTRALLYDHFALAFPATLLSTVFGVNVTNAELLAQGYVSPDGDYWTHAGTIGYDAAHFYLATSFTDPFRNTARVVYDTLQIAIVEEHTSAKAAFDNVTTATTDYRVLQPSLLTDPNGNQTAAAYDELGRVVAIALMGRPGANEGDTLADPTTKIEYDQLAWEAATPSPVYVHTYARLQHGPSNPGWFETYVYSDGSGHEALKKAQADPDSNGNAQWTGSGRVVHDNKGNPIKKYEPYFAADPSYDAESAIATTAYGSILRYDPLSRLVRTDFPDGTYATTEFDAWQEVQADGNDNVLGSAWYAAATALAPSNPLYRAASLAAADGNTPTTRVNDPRGRTFLVVADNGPGGLLSTRSQLDIQGNILRVTDALGNLTLHQTPEARGRVLKRVSPDAGTSSAIDDGVGAAYRAWDPRGFIHRRVHDVLHRLTQVWVTPSGGGAELLAEQTVYGEGLVVPNFRGHVYQQFDGAGVLTNAAYDFEDHVTHTTRQLAATYQSSPAWPMLATLTDPTAFLPAAASALEADTFDTLTTYDAMSRVVRVTSPDQSTLVFTYNHSSFLGALAAYMLGSTTASPIVTSVNYDAFGQRTAIGYGQGVVSQMTYDDRTHVLVRIQTSRSSDGAKLQDLNYTYDPVHNVVQVSDNAQQTVYFAGNVTSGTQQFVYDAIYRLTQATGREQPGQVGYALGPNGYPEAPLSSIPHRNDLQALLAYTEGYAYDAVGNLLSTLHQAAGAGWTRTQTYTPGSNHIATVSMPGDPAAGPYSGVFQHDAAGNMLQTSNLSSMTWDHAGRLITANLQGGGMAYFAYDSGGKRVRKIVQRQGTLLERVYDGAYERYRERSGTSMTSSTVTLESHTLHGSDHTRRFALVETKTIDTSTPNLTPNPEVRLQFSNNVNSACLETDETGVIVSYEEYYPYGGTSFREGSDTKRYRFAGKERDEMTGLYYFGARYFIPWLSRWASPDPAGFVDGTNIYVHVRDNPIRLRDPSGLQTEEEPAAEYEEFEPPAPPPPEPPKIEPSQYKALGVEPPPGASPDPIRLPQPQPTVVRGPNEPAPLPPEGPETEKETRGPGYVVGPYRQITKPSPMRATYGRLPDSRTAVEAHHGIPSEIARQIVIRYREGEAPALLIKTESHDATRAAWNTWVSRIDPKYKVADPATGQTAIDWAGLVRDKPDLPHEVSEMLFDAAKTPQAARQEYYRQFELYKANQEYKAEYQEYVYQLSLWTMKYGPQIRQGP